MGEVKIPCVKNLVPQIYVIILEGVFMDQYNVTAITNPSSSCSYYYKGAAMIPWVYQFLQEVHRVF